MRYRVTYRYLATGMDGRADERDHGIVEADNAKEAMDAVALLAVPKDTRYGGKYGGSAREFYRGCLTAKEVL